MGSTHLSRGRTNQKIRTRLALLDAARHLVDEGRVPSLDDVAEAALVSRATAYRYFGSADELLAEASIAGTDLGVPTEVLADLPPGTGVAARVDHVVRHVTTCLVANPRATHLMMRSFYDLWLVDPDSRPARRIDFIEASLEGHLEHLSTDDRARLVHALALVCGPEAVLSALDVCRLDPEQTVETVAWAAGAIIAAAGT